MSKLATFRIDGTTWEKFKQWANQKDSTASNELIKFVESCLSDTDSDTDHLIYKNLDICIDEKLKPLLDRLNTLEEKLSINCIDESIDTVKKNPEMISSNNPFDLKNAIALLEKLKHEGIKRPNKTVAARLNLRGYQAPNSQTKWTAKNIADWMRTGKF